MASESESIPSNMNEQQIQFFVEGEDPQMFNKLILEVSDGGLKKREDITKFISSFKSMDALSFPFILKDGYNIIINFGWMNEDYYLEIVDIDCKASKPYRVRVNLALLISKKVGDYSSMGMGLGMEVIKRISYRTFHDKCGKKPGVQVGWEK